MSGEPTDKLKANIEQRFDNAFKYCDETMELFRAWIELRAIEHSILRFPVMRSIYEDDIAYLDLSTRPENALRRNGINTIGDLVKKHTRIEDFSLMRNLGKLSAIEVMVALFCYQFSILSSDYQKRFIQKVIDLNMGLED